VVKKINSILSSIKKKTSHKVIKSAGWYTVTEFFLKGATFLTIPIFTRILTPSDYGLASVYLSWVSILTIIIGLNLNTSITRGRFDYKDDYDNFVSSIMFLSLLIFGGYLLLFVVFQSLISRLSGFESIIIFLMLVHAYFAFVKKSIITKFRVLYQYKKISVISIIISLLGVVLSIVLILLVFNNQPYIGKILGNASLIIVFGILFLFYLIKKGFNKSIINKSYWKYALLLSLPLMVHALSSIVNAQFDRIVINYYIDSETTGLYSFAYNIGMIISVLTMSLDQAWSPWVYETMDKGEYIKVKDKGKIYRTIYTVLFGGLLLISPEIIRIMAEESYWSALEIIPFIFLGYYFSYMYTLEVKTEFYFKRTGLISVASIFAAIINIILNLIFVPRYGYVAAAATTTISFFFLFIFHYLITSKVLKVKVYGIKFHIMSMIMAFSITGYYVLFTEIIFMRWLGAILLGIWLLVYVSFKSRDRVNKDSNVL
jgi:O-antigen/teichoic acid export membrane protein